MEYKNSAEVTIDGKLFSLSGYESEEYYYKLGSFVNTKLKELERMKGYSRFDETKKKLLIVANLANDYIKLLQEKEELEGRLSELEKEAFYLKKELIALQEEKGKNK